MPIPARATATHSFNPFNQVLQMTLVNELSLRGLGLIAPIDGWLWLIESHIHHVSPTIMSPTPVMWSCREIRSCQRDGAEAGNSTTR